MKKCLLALACLALPALAQWTDFSAQTASSNLYGAMNGKLSLQIGFGNPNGQFGCTEGKDQFLDSNNLIEYFCTATGSSSTAVWVARINAGGSYANPSWITALAWSKITGAPSTFNAGQILGSNIPSLSNGFLEWNGSALVWASTGAGSYFHTYGAGCQNGYGFSDFNVNSGDPSSAACDGGTDPKGIVEVSSGGTSQQYFSFVLPSGSTVVSVSASLDYWGTDTSHAIPVQYFYKCVAAGSPTQTLSYSSAAAAQNLTPSSSSNLGTASYSLSTSGCSPGNKYFGYLQVTNTLGTQTFNIVDTVLSGSVQ